MLAQRLGLFIALCLSLWLVACGPKVPTPDRTDSPFLDQVDYSIQAGAFSLQENAINLTQELNRKGLEAYYFRDRDRLYKVRFGNYPNYREAKKHAQDLQAREHLDSFFVVAPESYPIAQVPDKGEAHLRLELVRTANDFIGIPYKWGGASQYSGVDCSGLTKVVYRKNGLNLPRVASDQFRAGRPIDPQNLQKGDLIFFDTKDTGSVSHVGIYIGDGKFIHAPSSGRNVTTARLSHPYFKSRFLGARTYI